MVLKHLGAFLLLSTFNLSAMAESVSLADAVEKMDRAGICALLESGADVNRPQVDGMTAVHWAVYLDNLEIAKRLLHSGADAKAQNRYGVQPLSLACMTGNAAMVELLLDSGADPNTALRGGETALMTAARTGRLEPVNLLLSYGATVDAQERRGQTALIWAAAEGHAQVVDTLIQAGADFRAALDSGFTPMFFAVREGHSEVVKTLLDKGIDVNEAMQPRKSSGNAPKKGTSPLILAVENGHFELALRLLEAGADPNDQRSGFTALHTLTWVRKPDRGDEGDPSPVGSGDLNSLDFVKKLAEHGADVNARLESGGGGTGRITKKGSTPFLMASKTADIPLMRLLLELGADPLMPNVDNCTPLMAAAGLGTTAPGEEAGTEEEALLAVQMILELGGDVNGIDNNGETAMHGAAYKSLPKVVQLLAGSGAKIEIWNRKNKYGWTPLIIAEGYRPGNFKPSPETIAAIHQVMLEAGLTPPTTTEPALAADPYAQ